MDDPNRPMTVVERYIREISAPLHEASRPGLRPGTIVECPNFRRGRRYVVAPDGSLRRVKE